MKKKTKCKIKDEYQLQKKFHSWYIKKFPYVVACGCPYVSMRRHAQRMTVQKKGYQTGYPDYVIHDPRIFVKTIKDHIDIKIISGLFIEFKTPKGDGYLRKNQQKVLMSLKRRGFDVIRCDDLKTAKMFVMNHKRKGVPVYDSSVRISGKSLKMTRLKPKTPRVTLPRMGEKKKKRKRKEKSDNKRPKKKRKLK